MKLPALYPAIALLLLATSAGGQTITAPTAVCLDPGPAPPDSERPRPQVAKPIRPPCVDPDALSSHCSSAVIKRYNAQIQDYNRALATEDAAAQAFVDHMNGWMRKAQAYAKCEVNAMNDAIEAGN